MMEYSLGIKRNKLLIMPTTWLNIENYAEWGKTNPKRLYTVLFHSYNLEMTKLQK